MSLPIRANNLGKQKLLKKGVQHEYTKQNKNDTDQLLNQNLKIRDNEKELIKNEMKEKQLEAVYNAKIGQ